MSNEQLRADILASWSRVSSFQEQSALLNRCYVALGEQQSAPAGYVMVPVEPTPEMVRAGVDAAIAQKNAHPWCPPCYRAMLAAAPKAETVHDQQADRIADLERLLLDARGFVEAYVKNTFFGPNARGHLIKIDAALKGTTV